MPLDKALPANELESLIIRSGVEAIFYSKKYDEIMQDIKQRKTTDLRYYISMDLTERKEGVLSEREFIEKGKKLIEEGLITLKEDAARKRIKVKIYVKIRKIITK